MSKITDLARAGRLARTMASDIAIYNTERIRRGIAEDRLFEELKDDLIEGQQVWREKVSEEIVNGTNLFHKAFVDIVFAQHGDHPSRIY